MKITLLKYKVQAAFVSAIVILIVAGIFSYRATVLSRESDRWVHHTHEVLDSLNKLLTAVSFIESCSRGFALTAENSYLESCRVNIVNAGKQAAALRTLTADNPDQQRMLPALDRLVAQKIQYFETIIGLRRDKGLDAAAEAVRSGRGERIMGEFEAAVGQLRDTELQLLVQRDAEATSRSIQTKIILIFGTVIGVLVAVGAGIGVHRDILKRQVAEEALSEEKDRAQVTLDSIGDAVICTDTLGAITFINLVAEKMTGWLLREARGQPLAVVFRVIDATSREMIPHLLAEAIEQDRTLHLQANCILVGRSGSEIPIEDSIAPIRNTKGKVIGAVKVFRDVTAARIMAQKIAHSAQHDFLTGLPNRMLLDDRIGHAIALAKRHMKKVYVLFLDLDGFKSINDSLGHPVGDKLLQSVAARLSDCVREADTVSRQGGDEFVVLLSEVDQLEDASIAAQRILDAIVEPYFIDQHKIHTTTSIGLSVYPDDGLDPATLIKNADTAMYQAKDNGRHGYQHFEPAMNIRAVERRSIEAGRRRGPGTDGIHAAVPAEDQS
jgi:diguanylate cyclase (GGDEF)-like protein/PAS domain S-box-containing protein